MSTAQRIALASFLLLTVLAVPASATTHPARHRDKTRHKVACTAGQITPERALLNRPAPCPQGKCPIHGLCLPCN